MFVFKIISISILLGVTPVVSGFEDYDDLYDDEDAEYYDDYYKVEDTIPDANDNSSSNRTKRYQDKSTMSLEEIRDVEGALQQLLPNLRAENLFTAPSTKSNTKKYLSQYFDESNANTQAYSITNTQTLNAITTDDTETAASPRRTVSDQTSTTPTTPAPTTTEAVTTPTTTEAVTTPTTTEAVTTPTTTEAVTTPTTTEAVTTPTTTEAVTTPKTTEAVTTPKTTEAVTTPTTTEAVTTLTTTEAVTTLTTTETVTAPTTTEAVITPTATEAVTTPTTTSPTLRRDLDIPRLLDIIADLASEFETNLTRKLNETLFNMSIPTCMTPSTEAPTTSEYDANYTGATIAKCYVCGLDIPGIPQHAQCADAFAGDFLPLVPVDASAKGKISSFKKYCKYSNIPGYVTNFTHSRAIYGRWTGGCAVRWIDLSGVYTQRTCRSRLQPTMGKHFASKRMAKLERSLWNIDNGCIISPVATLLPLSRGISLYARFHACVCTGNWCNMAYVNRPWTSCYIILLLFNLCLAHYSNKNLDSEIS